MTQRIVSIQHQTHPKTHPKTGQQTGAQPQRMTKRMTKAQRSPTARWAGVRDTPPAASAASPIALPTFATGAQPATNVATLSPLAPKLAVSIAEAAQLLSISRSHLYPIVMRGEIPSFHIGRSHLIRVSALEAWIRRQEEEAA